MRMSADDFAAARDFAGWKARVHGAWNGVSVAHVGASMPDELPSVGDGLRVRAHVLLGELGPDDVAVEAIVGRVGDDGALRNARYVALEPRDGDPAPSIRFEGVVPLTAAGTFGYTVRVVPRNPAMADLAELGLVVGPE
jgi:starch phosphorylase